MRKVAVAVLVFAIVAACAGVAYWLVMKSGHGIVVSRALSIKGIRIYAISDRSTPKLTYVEVLVKYVARLPKSVGLSVEGGELRVFANSAALADLNITPQRVSGGAHTLAVAGYLRNDAIERWWVADLRSGGETNVTITGYVCVTALGSNCVRIPIRYSTFVETPMFPKTIYLNRTVSLGWLGSINVEKALITLNRVSDSATYLNADVLIRNDLKIPVAVGDLEYSVTLPNGAKIAGGYVGGVITIPAGGEGIVRIPLKISNSAIPYLWYFIVQGKGKANMTLNIWFRINYGSRSIEVFRNNPIKVNVEINAPIMKFK